MDRTIAARAPAGRLGGSSRGASAAGGAARVAASIRARLAAMRSRRHARIALICLLVALPLLAGGFLWLRHSSFVSVEHVRVTGAHGPQKRAIETALNEAAKRMSTLDSNQAELKAAVARFPQVSAIRVRTSFPHGMQIAVIQRHAVAALLVGGAKIAIGADGVVLGSGVAAGSLPTVADDIAPTSGERVHNTLVRQALAVLGAAPPALDRLTVRAWFSTRGLTVAMRSGLLVYFGDATRPHAKWLALATVLAEPSAAGATYIDVRTPERAAAGFAPGAGPAETGGGASEGQLGKGESTVATIAEKLAAATPEGRAKSEEEKTEEEPSSGGTSHEGEQAGASSEASSGGEEAPAATPVTGG